MLNNNNRYVNSLQRYLNNMLNNNNRYTQLITITNGSANEEYNVIVRLWKVGGFTLPYNIYLPPELMMFSDIPGPN